MAIPENNKHRVRLPRMVASGQPFPRQVPEIRLAEGDDPLLSMAQPLQHQHPLLPAQDQWEGCPCTAPQGARAASPQLPPGARWAAGVRDLGGKVWLALDPQEIL